MGTSSRRAKQIPVLLLVAFSVLFYCVIQLWGTRVDPLPAIERDLDRSLEEGLGIAQAWRASEVAERHDIGGAIMLQLIALDHDGRMRTPAVGEIQIFDLTQEGLQFSRAEERVSQLVVEIPRRPQIAVAKASGRIGSYCILDPTLEGGQSFELVLRPPPRVSVQALDPSGQLLPDAVIALSLESAVGALTPLLVGDDIEPQLPFGRGTPRDLDAVTEVPVWPDLPHRVEARHPVYGRTTAIVGPLGYGASEEVVLQFSSAAAVRVQLHGHDGAPVSGAIVSIASCRPGFTSNSGRALTDAAGVAVVSGLPAGPGELRATGYCRSGTDLYFYIREFELHEGALTDLGVVRAGGPAASLRVDAAVANASSRAANGYFHMDHAPPLYTGSGAVTYHCQVPVGRDVRVWGGGASRADLSIALMRPSVELDDPDFAEVSGALQFPGRLELLIVPRPPVDAESAPIGLYIELPADPHDGPTLQGHLEMIAESGATVLARLANAGGSQTLLLPQEGVFDVRVVLEAGVFSWSGVCRANLATGVVWRRESSSTVLTLVDTASEMLDGATVELLTRDGNLVLSRNRWRGGCALLVAPNAPAHLRYRRKGSSEEHTVQVGGAARQTIDLATN